MLGKLPVAISSVLDEISIDFDDDAGLLDNNNSVQEPALFQSINYLLEGAKGTFKPFYYYYY